MRSLVCNDDADRAAVIEALAAALRKIADVTIVVPLDHRSGASHSLTLERPLRAKQHGDGVQAVDGAPTNCIHPAWHSLLAAPPGLVISGINAGGKRGDDVRYSGTVAAATEACLPGISARRVAGRRGPQPLC